MWTNYLKIALRTLGKQKLYGAINVFGLALGIACCLLLLLFVADEVTFDRMHADGDRIFRVARVSLDPDGTPDGEPLTPYMPIPAGPALAADMPEVDAFVRFKQTDMLVRQGERTAEEEVVFADPAVLDVFTFPLRSGTGGALDRRDGVVLSEAAARKYFGDADPTGQPLAIRFQGTFEPFVVTAVADVPSNSTVRFDVLVPFERAYDQNPWMEPRADRFNASSILTYVRLRDDADLAAVEAKMPAFIEAHYGEHIQDMRDEGYWAGAGAPLAYYFQPLPAIHLDPHVHSGLTPPSNPLYAQILAAIALAVLLIACINFMTLAIGRSASRAKEVGVRKTMGARRSQLLGQFWGEALLMSTLGLALGLALGLLFLPTFNTLTGKALGFGLVPVPVTLAVLLGLAVLTGLVAGSYPALLLSRLRPAETLKSRVRLGGSNAFARSLVVVQFALSIFLLTGAFVLSAQLRYVQGRDLGYDREQLVVLPLDEAGYGDALARFRTALAGNTAVTDLTGASVTFGRGTSSYGFQHGGEQVDIVVYGVGSDFVETLGMDLLAGRDFDPDLATDSTDAVIVNEALVRAFGWADPVGQRLPEEFEWNDDVQAPLVIGVVRDFNFRSLHQAVDPALLMLQPPEEIWYGLARLAPGRTREGLDALENAWAEIAPTLPFDAGFLDDDLAAFYEKEEQWAQIIRWATLFALAVACLGLFGLASLTVAQRTKEIGIRKVLGATAGHIAVLLARGFAILVGVALAMAAPLAWLAAARWLDEFAYRIDLGPGLFLLAGALALGVALLTVGTQALRAATADPVKSLRYE
jgi:putative ABC transport system permease protein